MPAALGRAAGFADRMQRGHDPQAQPRCQPGNVVHGFHDVGRAGRARLVVRRVGHGDAAQRAQVRQEIRIVEDRGDRLPPAGLTVEREVADGDAARRGELGQGPQPVEAVARPARPVDDEPVGGGQQVAHRRRPEERLVRPPHGDRQIVDDERRDERREMTAGLAARREMDHLGADLRRVLAWQHAVCLDTPVQPGRAVRIRRGHQQGPRRVAAGEGLDGGGAALRDLRPSRDDDQVHHARAGRDVPDAVVLAAGHAQVDLRPDLRQLLLDADDRVGLRGPAELGRAAARRFGDQIRRHCRPSRASRSSASGGPHVPAS